MGMWLKPASLPLALAFVLHLAVTALQAQPGSLMTLLPAWSATLRMCRPSLHNVSNHCSEERVCMMEQLSSVLCGAPPIVENAFLIGRKRSHYDIHSVARYQCADGFLQRHIPTAKCRANGKWDRPKIICTKSRRSHRYRRHHHKGRRERRKHKHHGHGQGHHGDGGHHQGNDGHKHGHF